MKLKQQCCEYWSFQGFAPGWENEAKTALNTDCDCCIFQGFLREAGKIKLNTICMLWHGVPKGHGCDNCVFQRFAQACKSEAKTALLMGEGSKLNFPKI